MDELDAADIQAARWLVEDQERQVAGELARDDELLLIAAGERSGADRRGGRANVVLADALLGSCLDRLVVAQEAARVGSPVVVGQDEVVGKREREHEPESVPVGRDVGDGGLVDLARGGAGDIAAPERDSASGCVAKPDDRLDELVLAVARDAGDAEDLAGADIQVNAMHDDRASVVLDFQAADLERDLGGLRLPAIDRQLDLAADHQLRQVVLVGLRRESLADDLAASDDRDPVGDFEHLVQLVADEDDAVAFLGQAAQDAEDLLGFLWGQHRGWLVQDEDPGVAIERLEDLDALLPADRQRADLRLRVDHEAEPPAELDDPAVGLLPIEEDRARHRFLAEQDVLGDGEDGDQHEVLVDHVDAARDRVRGTRDGDFLAVEQDRPLVRPGQPVEDVHERRLAGAVLAEQGVDLAGADLQIDLVVGDHARIALGDAPHLEGRRDHRRFPRRHLGRHRRLDFTAPGETRAGRPVRRGPLESSSTGGCYFGNVEMSPHLSGQVLIEPALICAKAASSLPFRSAGTLLARSWNGE